MYLQGQSVEEHPVYTVQSAYQYKGYKDQKEKKSREYVIEYDSSALQLEFISRLCLSPCSPFVNMTPVLQPENVLQRLCSVFALMAGACAWSQSSPSLSP